MSAVTDTAPVLIDGMTIEFSADDGGAPNRVVDELTLSCAPGEILVLIGPSGCGKTTVLNAIAGLVTPTAGTVSVLGTDPKTARRQLGYMFARDALLPWRRALANVEYTLEIRGVPSKERRETAREYMRLLGVGHAERRWPWQLSQGMRQRVALARTWASDPRLVLMDEPFSALDAQTRASAREEFIRIWERDQHSVVFVTHDLTEAILIGDRVVVLNHGRIQFDEHVPFERPRDALELQEEPRFREWRRELWSLLDGPTPEERTLHEK
jgi:NitT/TauT family transport system ATP-binding protein